MLGLPFPHSFFSSSHVTYRRESCKHLILTIASTTGLLAKRDHSADIPRLLTLSTIMGKQRGNNPCPQGVHSLMKTGGGIENCQPCRACRWRMHEVWVVRLRSSQAALCCISQGCFPAHGKPQSGPHMKVPPGH